MALNNLQGLICHTTQPTKYTLNHLTMKTNKLRLLLKNVNLLTIHLKSYKQDLVLNNPLWLIFHKTTNLLKFYIPQNLLCVCVLWDFQGYVYYTLILSSSANPCVNNPIFLMVLC